MSSYFPDNPRTFVFTIFFDISHIKQPQLTFLLPVTVVKRPLPANGLEAGLDLETEQLTRDLIADTYS